MPTSQRSTYHHGDLANALMAVAVERARAGGPEAVVLRELARDVGVSPQAVYRHYPTFDDLLDGLRQRVLAMVGAVVRAAVERAGPPRSPQNGVRAAVEAYVTFACDAPGLFRAASSRHAEPPDTVLGTALAPLLDSLVAGERVSSSQRPVIEGSVRAAAHGMAVLFVDGPLRHALPAEQRVLRRQMADVLLSGLFPGQARCVASPGSTAIPKPARTAG